jgi:hypothetical protein
MDEDKKEEIICNNHDKIERAIDILYYNFKSFGWSWYEGIPNRDKISEVLRELVNDAIDSGMVETGRIRVEYDGSEYGQGLGIYLSI